MSVTWLLGDVRERMREILSGSVQCCVTSPPYYALRAYSGTSRVIGNEPTVEEYVSTLVSIFREVRRCLHPTGVLFLNLGDSFARDSKKGRKFEGSAIDTWEGEGARAGSALAGLKPKDKMLVPYRVALAMQDDGWFVRADMPWVKRSILPDSVKDRPTVANETVFMLTPSERCFYDYVGIRQTGSFQKAGNKRALKGVGDDVQRRRLENILKNVDENANGYTHRAFRSTDPFLISLRHILDGGEGVVLDDEGDPLVLAINTRPSKEKHFAVMSPPLAETLVRAGTSERGQCPACGSPWVRVVDRKPNPSKWANVGVDRSEGAAVTSNPQTVEGLHRGGEGGVYCHVETRGWKPSCDCPPADPVPQVVLDPFGGSGTTSYVAEKLGRDSVYIDANPEYLEIAQRRVGGAAVLPLPPRASEPLPVASRVPLGWDALLSRLRAAE